MNPYQCLNKEIRKCRLSDLKHLVPMYFNATYSYLTNELRRMRLRPTKQNLANFLTDSIKDPDAGWSEDQIIKVAATLELENLVNQAPGSGQKWQALRMFSSNPGIINDEENKAFPEVLRKAFSSQHTVATILVKKTPSLLWVAVIRKHTENVNIRYLPIHFVISTDFQYIFIKNTLPTVLRKAVEKATNCRKVKSLELDGCHVESLLAMLQGRDSARAPRPAFVPQTPKLNNSGCDFTHGTDVGHYTKQCLGDSISLEQYSVEPANKRWQGDEVRELRLVEVKSEVVFSGNVSALFGALPAAGICSPPFPRYIRDFTVLGRTHVSSEV